MKTKSTEQNVLDRLDILEARLELSQQFIIDQLVDNAEMIKQQNNGKTYLQRHQERLLKLMQEDIKLARRSNENSQDNAPGIVT